MDERTENTSRQHTERANTGDRERKSGGADMKRTQEEQRQTQNTDERTKKKKTKDIGSGQTQSF
jgi:hypothetical protein